eukprot:1374683-Ditylum_brightwellii.AAC.1
MKAVLLFATLATVAAFAPAPVTQTSFPLRSTETTEETEVAVAANEEEAIKMDDVSPVAPSVAAINGWVPDEFAPCFGLPGAIAPTGFFDPLRFAQA